MENLDGFNQLYQALMEYYRLPPDKAARQLSAILRRVDAAKQPSRSAAQTAQPTVGG